ncbi:serrate RNA effector molecule homolog [Clavelina lepadiformis]|uniref:serrate RNA effector molecule homolog n=1 Tax=Clavelina lepadiformis TaxID=159417 RepID=UPI004041D1E5
MGDSEDEYDRQRREKFQRERSDQFDRRARERDWPRERPRGWNNSSGMPAGEMKQGGGMRPMPGGEVMHRRRMPDYAPPPPDMKRRFSPGREHDMRARKRMRPFEPGFEQGGWGGPGWDQAGGRPPFPPRDEWGQGDRGPHPMDMEQSGARMMTFKQWLNMQSDDITDEEAVTKYTDYKIGFRRQQLQEFFVAHKDEEWFKEKYHPDDAEKRFVDEQTCIRWRANVFKQMIELSIFDEVDLDLANEAAIVKVLDSGVILMEGGNADDLKVLEMDPALLEAEMNKPAAEGKTETSSDKTEGASGPAGMTKPAVLSESQHELKKQAQLYKQLVDNKTGDEANEQKPADAAESKSRKKKKRDREYMGYDDEDAGSSEESDESDQEDAAKVEDKKTEPSEDLSNETSKENEEKPEDGEVDVPKPRALHKTHSIFMRNLPPSVTKSEIANLCKKFPGFIRVAFSHPLEDRNRFYRRCWVTFDRSVNIKDICWNLNNLRLRDLELNPVVNRDLSRRVRPISGIAQHSTCARNDLRNVARLIMHLDTKWKLWGNSQESKESDDTKSENPWLKNISEFLVDETSAEEEELLGEKVQEEGEDLGETTPVVKITRDVKLVKVLDKLLYYLRVVHSVDYYNASEYPCEDEMPNRCGIVHARGPIPPNMLTKSDINEFQKRFNDKLVHILNFKDKLTEEEAKKLGPKDVESEVEKFITSNTQELGKDKWLCPLSGKKFKGPDYIRKHIFNKHAEKIEAVKKEVVYFNNYLMDPRRPGPMEGQAPKSAPSPHPQGGPGYPPLPPGRGFGPPPGTPPFRGDPGRPQFSTPQFHQRPPAPYGNGGRTYPPKGRDMRPSGGDPFSSRPIVGYQDLDAPDDTDFF